MSSFLLVREVQVGLHTLGWLDKVSFKRVGDPRSSSPFCHFTDMSKQVAFVENR